MKILTFDQSKCDGCKLCQGICALRKTGEVCLPDARVRIQTEPVLRAAYCQHCAEPTCVTACMRGIISKGEDGRVVRKTEDCFRCAACAVMCPVGAVVLDEQENAFVTCDLCGGDPVCVKICPTGALKYEDVEKTIAEKRNSYARMAMQDMMGAQGMTGAQEEAEQASPAAALTGEAAEVQQALEKELLTACLDFKQIAVEKEAE